MENMRLQRSYFIIILLLTFTCLWANPDKTAFTISLNGPWEMGSGRNYSETVIVPGIHTDATVMNPEKLWYRKEVVLPEGNWKYATLELKGARFAPEVYVNGISVSKKNGGMAPTFHLLNQKGVRPGDTIIIEIALTSLKDLSDTDASYIPVADQWRSNISSGLWSDVTLKLHGDYRIDRIVPFIDFNSKRADISFDLSNFGPGPEKNKKAKIDIFDSTGSLIFSTEGNITLPTTKIPLEYGDHLKPWSPTDPNLYKLKLTIVDGKDTIDESTISFGVKDFRTKDKQFYLNNNHIRLLGGTVVWHRWMRDQEGRALGYDEKWFTENVILPLKERGANYLRFHLGVPPEKFLDLCDEYGLAVQFEWNFFHGMPATKESLLEQYPKWLDVAMRHPSVCLIHPYNETEGNQLGIVWEALDTILKDYPPLVMEERDVIHVHKYWWSLFENLGLYYDSAEQFPKAIMVDEFGGNYLDGQGMMGGYPAIPETYLRFLGRNHTKESQLAFHSNSNSKVAEYWRRINAAGVAPFCILGSERDGNHWYMGNLAEGNLKPVWDGLTCAWSTQSVSMEIWDRNYVPAQEISVPIYLFNDTPNQSSYKVKFSLVDSLGKVFNERFYSHPNIEPFSKKVVNYNLKLPNVPGKYTLSAELENRPDNIKHPVISKWKINVFKSKVPKSLLKSGFSVATDEPEIIQFLESNNIRRVALNDISANMIMLSKAGWDKIAKSDKVLIGKLDQAIKRGVSVLLLDVGERLLGQGYPEDKNDLGPLSGVIVKENTPVKTYDIFSGIRLSFREVAEPESHIHPDKYNAELWNHIPKDRTWLWNGMRGGLIAPAEEMEISGLSQSAFIEQWRARGADEKLVKEKNYYAYELQGFYGFSTNPIDKALEEKLKQKVKFLVEDAPSLKASVNPLAPIIVTDLSQEYKLASNGIANSLKVLVNAGKNLTKAPVFMVGLGPGKGKIIISQLLTKGRLGRGFGENGLYGIRYDEVTVQMVLNMMDLAMDN